MFYYVLHIACRQPGHVVSRPPAPNRVQKFKLGQDLLLGHFKQLMDLWSRNPLCVTDLMNKVKQRVDLLIPQILQAT